MMENTMTSVAERRRSVRLWMTIPLRVEGVDSSDRTRAYEGRAIGLNRYGARIQISQPLDQGQAIRLRSPMGCYDADFRVVGLIGEAGEKGGDYGMECLDQKDNFWGILFPVSDGAADARVLLECGICHSMALLPLTLTEVEALRANGTVGAPCQNCVTESPWKYAEWRMPPHRAAELEGSPARRWPGGINTATGPLERGHRRVYMQLPIGIRDGRGNVEMTRTENISRCGFCFVTEKNTCGAKL